jgi:hypothetical protein
MDKTISGLLGVIAGLATMGSAQAATSPVLNPSGTAQASSYADLLAPIPNAVELLKADDAARAQQPAKDTQIAQGYYYPYYYGPYESPYYYPYYRYYHHHHHHHHHYRYHHHHHHHHHHY